ncbi:MAG: hypothetical protein ABSF28_14290 [Terracidiphilus sp.]|jgi:hypothetical protein
MESPGAIHRLMGSSEQRIVAARPHPASTLARPDFNCADAVIIKLVLLVVLAFLTREIRRVWN